MTASTVQWLISIFNIVCQLEICHYEDSLCKNI